MHWSGIQIAIKEALKYSLRRLSGFNFKVEKVEWWWGEVGEVVPAFSSASSCACQGAVGGRAIAGPNDPYPKLVAVGRTVESEPEEFVRVCLTSVWTPVYVLLTVSCSAGSRKVHHVNRTSIGVMRSSGVDACADACWKSVCATAHHVRNWNGICMSRCQSQCLKTIRSERA
ncbi:hypothetical protein R1sor_018547 [Riccia sorocarpa]|uniref:Uncharacterized protein n=1 Tax=Riccia sorocarpa TaxID=122646 RepID=A0ABD3IDK5_9MARC